MKLDQAMPNPWQILAKVQTFTRMLQIFKVFVYFPKSLRPYRTKNRTKKKITIIIHLDRLSSPIFFAPTSKSIHPSTHFKMKESSKCKVHWEADLHSTSLSLLTALLFKTLFGNIIDRDEIYN